MREPHKRYEISTWVEPDRSPAPLAPRQDDGDLVDNPFDDDPQ